MTQQKQDMKDILFHLKQLKDKDREEFENIKYIKNPNALPQKIERKNKKLIKLQDKDELKSALKSTYRVSWRGKLNSLTQKDPGYTNKEFNNVKPMKPRILNAWEQDRTIQPYRNYQYPKGYKGFKNGLQKHEFGEPVMEQYPPHFQESLKERKLEYQDFVFTASKYGKIKTDYQLENVLENNKEPFRKTNTVQYKNLGLPKHNTHEFEQYKRSDRGTKFSDALLNTRPTSMLSMKQRSARSMRSMSIV